MVPQHAEAVPKGKKRGKEKSLTVTVELEEVDLSSLPLVTLTIQ